MLQLNLNLIGSICQIIEFIGDETKSDLTETNVLFFGTIEKIHYSQTILTLSVVPNTDQLRRNNLLYVNDQDTNIPVTFGQSDPINKKIF